MTLAFLWDKTNWPDLSSLVSTITSTLSPTLRSGLYLNSFFEITPSDFALISIIMSFSVKWITSPSIILSSDVSTKFFSTSFSNSLICLSSSSSINTPEIYYHTIYMLAGLAGLALVYNNNCKKLANVWPLQVIKIWLLISRSLETSRAISPMKVKCNFL